MCKGRAGVRFVEGVLMMLMLTDSSVGTRAAGLLEGVAGRSPTTDETDVEKGDRLIEDVE